MHKLTKCFSLFKLQRKLYIRQTDEHNGTQIMLQTTDTFSSKYARRHYLKDVPQPNDITEANEGVAGRVR